MKTYEQKMAETAFECIGKKPDEKYRTFAMSFPSLIHSCGLVQAISFAQRQTDKQGYLNDLQRVFASADESGDLMALSRSAASTDYMRITRRALSAASWLKRYVQAFDDKTNKQKDGGSDG